MADSNKLKGLDGWLIIFQISFYILLLWIVYETIFSIRSDSLFLIISTIINISIIIFLSYCLIIMYQKKEYFPKVTIIFLWTYFCWLTIFCIIGYSQVLTTSIDKKLIGYAFFVFFSSAVRGLIFAIICTWYLAVSKRVKNTFTKK